MARPRRCRKICTEPAYDSFKPEGISVGEEITMTVDEYEVIRLVGRQCGKWKKVTYFRGRLSVM